MTEAQLQAAVEAICIRRGLLWHHCSDARKCHGPRGYPDLVVVGRRGIVFAELKSDDGETTAAQDRWHWTIDRVGSLDVKPRLWRPNHLTLGNIEHELGSIALWHHSPWWIRRPSRSTLSARASTRSPSYSARS